MYSEYDNVILTDCDGVLLYWEHGFDMWMKENGYTIKRINEYEAHDRYGLTKDQGDFMCKMFNESASIKFLAPVLDSIKYIKKLHEDHGYVFHTISAIPNTPHIYEARKENLENLYGKTVFEKLILCDSSSNKVEHLLKYVDSNCVWIEDLKENAEIGLDLGLDPLLFTRHYNRDYSGPVKRVNNWKDIYEHIVGE